MRVKNVDLSETFFAATEHEMHHVNAGRWKEQKPIFEPPVSNCAYFKNTALIDLPQRFHEIGQTGWKFHIEERIFAAKKCYSSLSSGPTQFFFDLIIE